MLSAILSWSGDLLFLSDCLAVPLPVMKSVRLSFAYLKKGYFSPVNSAGSGSFSLPAFPVFFFVSFDKGVDVFGLSGLTSWSSAASSSFSLLPFFFFPSFVTDVDVVGLGGSTSRNFVSMVTLFLVAFFGVSPWFSFCVTLLSFIATTSWFATNLSSNESLFLSILIIISCCFIIFPGIFFLCTDFMCSSSNSWFLLLSLHILHVNRKLPKVL